MQAANTLSLAPRTLSRESLVAAHLNLVYSSALRQVQPAPRGRCRPIRLSHRVKKVHRVPPARLAPWLIKVTRYVAINTLRSNRRRAHHEARKSPCSSPPDHPPNHPCAPHLDDALAHLRESDRETLILRYFQNRSIPQIAAALNTSENTASKRVERALAKLRTQLLRHGAVPFLLLALLLPVHPLAPTPCPIALTSTVAAPQTNPLADILIRSNPSFDGKRYHTSLSDDADHFTAPDILVGRQLALAPASPDISPGRYILTLDVDNTQSGTAIAGLNFTLPTNAPAIH